MTIPNADYTSGGVYLGSGLYHGPRADYIPQADYTAGGLSVRLTTPRKWTIPREWTIPRADCTEGGLFLGRKRTGTEFPPPGHAIGSARELSSSLFANSINSCDSLVGLIALRASLAGLDARPHCAVRPYATLPGLDSGRRNWKGKGVRGGPLLALQRVVRFAPGRSSLDPSHLTCPARHTSPGQGHFPHFPRGP